MNGKELKRLKVLNDLEAGIMTMVQASKALGLSLRHVYRLRARYRREGAPARAPPTPRHAGADRRQQT